MKSPNFFREIFEKDNQGTAKEYPPSSMKKPCTKEEISNGIQETNKW